MTPEEIKLVQTTFEQVAPNADAVAVAFYNQLFTLDPSLKPLFKSDPAEQRRKLMASLVMVVRSLHQPEKILSAVQELGKRHLKYNVKPEHYDTVGQALLMTLEKGLGSAFTPQVKAAWVSAYTLLANVMKEASYGKAA